MEKISTEKAPMAVGPYSQAVKYNKMLFLAGQIGADPKTNVLVEGFDSQVKQTLENLKHVLEASGSSMNRALKVSVFLKSLNNFQRMNEIFSEYFTNKPARSTIEVSNLPKGALVEMDVIAECD